MDSLGKRNSEASLSENVKYPCKDGTVLYTTEGDRTEGDKKIWIKPTKTPWMPTIECLLAWIRMKGWFVEQNNYPNGQGKKYLHRAIQDALYCKDLTIREICRKFKIPGF